jgi:POT family proton-dependent oligopeptide transporter
MTGPAAVPTAAAPAAGRPSLLAHPPGLRTLFFTELWERFSYYGMRALLVLFMVEAVADGGLGFNDATATAIYGLYTAAVYAVALPGGWIADRLLGAQRAIWYGGIVITLGHFTLAIPSVAAFFLGLLLIILGTGLLKPNISAVVGELYAQDDPRRDAGFTLFYMGINLGAALGPLVCSTLGESERFGWHYGFAAAGVGMACGLAYFGYSRHRLGDAGLYPSNRGTTPAERAARRRGWLVVGASVATVVALAGAVLSGTIAVDAVALASYATVGIVVYAGLYIAWLVLFGGLTAVERGRVLAIFVLSMAAAVFWSGFEQAGSTLNLFAERYTNRLVGSFVIPAGWFQSLNAVFIVVLAPVFASAWVALANRNREPSTPAKFAIGLVTLALGFAVLIPAAGLVAGGERVTPTWLITTYLLHTMGELTLSPVGLSVTTKLAPHRYVGQMMGIWFLTSALGNLLAGLSAGRFDPGALGDMPGLYLQIVVMTGGTGLLLLLFRRPIRRLMGGIH